MNLGLHRPAGAPQDQVAHHLRLAMPTTRSQLTQNLRLNSKNAATITHSKTATLSASPRSAKFLKARLLAVLLLLHVWSLVAAAAADVLDTGSARWSDSFSYEQHQHTFVRHGASDAHSGGGYGDGGDRRPRLAGGSRGEDWRQHWNTRPRLREQKPSQTTGHFPEAGLRGGAQSLREHHRALWMEKLGRPLEGQPSRKRRTGPPRLRFNKQVKSSEKAVDIADPGAILGAALPSLSMISICYADWTVCDDGGDVVAIDLSGRGLHGPIPPSFALFTALEFLNLKNNSLSGSLPSWLGLLANLTTLNLSFNKLSGQIPTSLGRLRNLQFLDLSYNRLEGTIPAQLSGMASLVVMKLARNRLSGPMPPLCGLTRVRLISLGYNNLTGALPTTVGCFRTLVVLSLAHNNFSGPVPAELGGLPFLRVLDLQSNRLTGGIPPELGLLQRLQVLWLQNNGLSGGVPGPLGGLGALEHLQLAGNQLEGALPSSLGMLSSLRVLDLSNNLFNGSLPVELSLLTNLKALYVNHTLIAGSIPPSYGNLVSLNILSLSSNNISGEIPTSLGNLGALLYLDLESNHLTGEIPPSLAHCTFLSHLLLSSNSLTGEIPATFTYLRWLRVAAMAQNNLTGALPAWGAASPLLEEIILLQNSFTGSVPPEWGELFLLRVVALSYNSLSGAIPDSLTQCTRLEQLWLDHNALTGGVGEWVAGLQSLVSLSLAHNALEGPVPRGFSQCKLLQALYLGSNSFGGEIPDDLGGLPSLVVFSLSSNNLSGPVPPSLGGLQSLEGLDLDRNLLTGIPPPELVKLASLQFLLLGHNNLTGPFPAWVTQLNKLQALDLSFNDFEGEIPLGFTNLVHFASPRPSWRQPTSARLNNTGLESLYTGASRGQTHLILAGNRLTGPIPSDFGRLKNLWVLDIRENRLAGPIPVSLGGATALCHLDLSQNALNGSIPRELENLSFLSFLNVSHNHLSGRIPDRGQFDTFGQNSFLGNWGLCGVPVGVPCSTPSSTTPVQAANTTESGDAPSRSHGEPHMVTLIGIVLASVLGTWALLALFVWWDLSRRRTILTRVLAARGLGTEEDWPTPKEALSINVAMFQKFLPKLTLADLMEATNSFAIENVIGDGGFGTVYKAIFQGDKVVAVKRLMGDKAKGEREFLAEMETLGKVKHSNVVPLMGYCTCGTDRLLIYEYMPNGNLDLWLHTSARVSAGRKSLNWSTRLKIALGTARGIAFLHHVCVPHIIHRDIKASNVLLDKDFNAYVSDFGLARLISAYDTHLSTAFAGTVGYIPPEYGQSPLASTRGDVYSFGVVLLEILTGRRPTDRFFRDKEDSDLISWVRHLVLQNKILDVFDPELVLELDLELVDHVDRLAGYCGGGGDSDVHPHFFAGSSQGSSPVSPFFSPDVDDLKDGRGRKARVTHSASELRVLPRVLAPRRSLGCSGSCSPASASNARRSAFGCSPAATAFEGIPEFECRNAENGMKQELITALGLAVWCTEDAASKRPTMLQACKLLDKIVNTRRGSYQ